MWWYRVRLQLENGTIIYLQVQAVTWSQALDKIARLHESQTRMIEYLGQERTKLNE